MWGMWSFLRCECAEPSRLRCDYVTRESSADIYKSNRRCLKSLAFSKFVIGCISKLTQLLGRRHDCEFFKSHPLPVRIASNLHLNMAEPRDFNADPSAIQDWIRKFDVSVLCLPGHD